MGNCAHIDEIRQSSDGKVIVFSTYNDQAVWSTTNDEFRRCGNTPFAVSHTGNTLVSFAKYEPNELRVYVRSASEYRMAAISLSPCLANEKGWRAASVRCDDNLILVHVIKLSRTSDENRSEKWLRVSLATKACDSIDGSTWDSIVDAPVIQQTRLASHDSTQFEYRSRSGIRLIQSAKRNEPFSITQFTVDGTSKVLLREDLGPFWGRMISNSGLQYP